MSYELLVIRYWLSVIGYQAFRLEMVNMGLFSIPIRYWSIGIGNLPNHFPDSGLITNN
jgi:hypothetical protein